MLIKLSNARKKNIEEIITRITKNNDVIIAEKLKVKNMLEKQNNKKNLRKEINNATFSKLLRKLEYKCKWLNKTFYQVDTYYPGSQICCRCDNRDKKMRDIRIRKYECEECGNK